MDIKRLGLADDDDDDAADDPALEEWREARLACDTEENETMDITPEEIAEQVLGAAGEWFDRLRSEEEGGNLWRDFKKWLEAAPIHGLAYDAVADAWYALMTISLGNSTPT